MFFLIVPTLIIALQVYFYVKSRRFIKDVIPVRWHKVLQIGLAVFFIWMVSPLLLMMVFDRSFWRIQNWELYVFVYPLLTWLTACVMLAVLFITKDVCILLWKGGKKLVSWYYKVMPSYIPEKTEEKAALEDPGRRNFYRSHPQVLPLPQL